MRETHETGPPHAQQVANTTMRVVEKQARPFTTVARRVAIVSDAGDHFMCGAGCVQRYLNAPNAELIVTHGGKLRAIKLHSVGDDRGHSAEHHGNSVFTTKRPTERFDEVEHRWIDGRNVREGIRHPYSKKARALLT